MKIFKELLSVYLLYLILCHLFFYKLLTPNHNVFATDKQVQGQVFSEVVKEKELKGEFPYWTNDILGGMPTQASFFTSKQLLDKVWMIVAYPLFLPSNLLGKYFTDEYGMIYWFSLFGFFMFIYLRSLGVSYFASFVGGLAFLSCTGFVSLFYPGHHSGKVPVIGMMPLILFFLNNAFEKEKNALLFTLLAGFFLARTMTFHIQIFFLLCVALLVYLLLKILFDFIEKRNKKRCFKFLIFTGFFFLMPILLNADQLLPRLEFKKYTHRGSETQVSEMDKAAMPGVNSDLEKYYFVTSFSQPPEDLLGLFMRYPFGMGKPYGGILKEVELPYYRGRYELRLSLEYVGVFVFILALLGAIKYIRLREVKLIIILGIVSILLSLGKYTILFDILYKMPGFKNFRIPLVYTMVSYFSFAALCGFGTNYIENFIKKRENGLLKGFLIALSGITFILFVVAILGSLFERAAISFLLSFELVREMLWGIYQDVFQRYAIFLYNLYFLVGALILTCLFLYLVIRKVISAKFVYFLIPLAIALDLWTLNNKFIIIIPKAENVKSFMAEDELVKFLKQDKSYFRIKSTVDEVNNRWALFGISNIEGYHPTPLKNFEDVYSLTNFTNNVDNLLNIKYLLVNPENPIVNILTNNNFLKNKYKKIKETTFYSISEKREKPVWVYKNTMDYGRAFFVYSFGIIENENQALAILGNPTYNPKEAAILNEKPKQSFALKKGTYDNINFVKYEPNKIEILTESDGNGLLILSENWYPAWTAYIDGQKTDIIRAYTTLRAVYIPSGKHKLEFKYESKSLFYGQILFFIGLLLTIINLAIAISMWERSEK